MVLYHGSNMAVENPDLNHSKTNLDFGAGFYTTSDLDQAKRWAVSTTRRRGTGEPTVTIYRANSTLTQQTIGIYLSGIITEKMCIQLLKPHKLKNQYTFKTEQAIATLVFKDVIRNW